MTQKLSSDFTIELGIPSSGKIWLFWTALPNLVEKRSEWCHDNKGRYVLEKEATCLTFQVFADINAS
jgi:hypothetical protein